jgi:hypothetical protein
MKKLHLILITASSFLALNASAAVPEWATTILEDAAADAATIGAATGAVVAVVLGIALTIKLIKRMVSKI